MKKISSIIFLSFLVLFLLVGCDKSSSDNTNKNLTNNVTRSSSDWMEYSRSKDGDVYSYDKGNIKKGRGKHIVQVWEKEVYSDEGKEKLIQDMTQKGLATKGYEKLSYTITLYEIDCYNRSGGILSITHYDKNGVVLYNGLSSDEPKWEPIKLDSIWDTLRTKVCPN
jgi:uncharacterized protein YxeA